jgi:hypothetical protein
MLPAITSSTLAAQRRLSFYIAVNLASVLAPGIVIVIAIVLLIGSSKHPSSPLFLFTYFKNYTGISALLSSIIVVAVGYVIGYISRELAFKFLQQLEKVPDVRDRLNEGVDARLKQYFSQSLVDDCFQAHRALRELPAAADTESTQVRETPAADAGAARANPHAGGGHAENISYRNFTYAKLWIRNYAPGFSIDSIEAEINILASGLIPTLLGSVDIIVIAHAAWYAILAGVLFIGLTWSVLLNSILRLRRTERWEAVRNLVMDYAMREASNKVPPIPEGQSE